MENGLSYLNIKDYTRGKKLVLFGASMAAVEAVNMINGAADIAYICDNDARKFDKRLLGIEIKPPLTLEKENKEKVCVLISSERFKEIGEQLSQMGVKDTVTHKSLLKATSEVVNGGNVSESVNVVGKEFHIDSADTETRAKIETLFNLIEDDPYSKELLSYIVKNRTERDEIDWEFVHKGRIKTSPYFSNEAFSENKGDELIVDGGLESCNDFKHFYRVLGSRLKRVYGFEPDKRSFARINEDLGLMRVLDYGDKTYKTLPELFDIKLFPYALSDKNGMIYFENGITSGAGAPENAVETRTIDETVDPREKVTIIKLDIEGAEMDALKGAVRTITEHKPRLMVCIYHKPADLWEIPLFIKKLCPEYKLYIKPHDGYKSVLEVHAV